MIQTEAEYEAVMRRVSELMDAEPDTPESDELERLSAEVGAYEDAHYPMGKPTPEEVAAFRREQEGRPK